MNNGVVAYVFVACGSRLKNVNACILSPLHLVIKTHYVWISLSFDFEFVFAYFFKIGFYIILKHLSIV